MLKVIPCVEIKAVGSTENKEVSKSKSKKSTGCRSRRLSVEQFVTHRFDLDLNRLDLDLDLI